MNNILFFLTPKALCAHLYDDYTVRQALEKMESAGYAALSILNRQGEYVGTLTEGDLLWAIKNMCSMDMKQAETQKIMNISRRKDNVPVRVTTSMQELVDRASYQNFVPVVDDKNTFIGIVTRRAIIKYCQQTMFPEAELVHNSANA
ncbi:MAG: CBS domain-containing protein [Faecousia sp.]